MTNRLVAHFKRISGGSLLRRNISMTLGRQLLAALAQLLLVVIIARELGPEGNGHYAMAILVPTLLATFLNLGVGPATVYYVGRGEFNARQAAWENAKLGTLIAGGALVVAVPALHLWGSALFPGVPQELLFAGLAAFPITLLLAYLSTVLQGLEQFRAFNASVLLPPYVALVGVAVSLYGLDAGALGAVVAYVIGQSIGLLAVIVYLRKLAGGETAPGSPVSGRRYRRATISYGWKAHLSNILAFVNYRADIFIVNILLNPAATGLYVVAVQIAERLWMLSRAASTVLLPRLSAMHADPQARLKLTQKGFVLVAGVTAAASLLAGLLLYWLIEPIFGEAYRDALPAFLWLLPGVVAGAGARIQANCIAAAGRPEWNMYVAFGVVGLNIIGNLVLVPAHGIVGAAWATSVAYVLNAVVKHLLVIRVAYAPPGPSFA